MPSLIGKRRAWFTVGFSTLAMTLSVNGLVLAPYGIMIKPIGEEFGWSRTTVTGALSLFALTAALVMPLMGGLLDRYGFRRVVVPGVLVSGILLALLAVVPPSIALWFLIMGVLGVVSTPQNGVPYYKLASQWLDGRRGLALGIIGTGGAVGGALVPQYVGALIELFNWRLAFLGLGILLVVVTLPIASFLLREPYRHELPQLKVHHESGELPGMELGEALRSRKFWQLIVAVLLVGSAVPGVVVQMVPLLTDQGLSTDLAIVIVSAMGLATMFGRLAGGFLLDYLHAPRVAAVVFSAPILGFILLTNGDFIAALIGALLVGMALGGEGDLVSYMTSRYMGVRFFGQIYGIFMAVLAFGYAFGPFAFAASYDLTGSYDVAFVVAGTGLVVSSVLVLRMGPYNYPPIPVSHRRSDVDDAEGLSPTQPGA